jgi:hypothetical protein
MVSPAKDGAAWRAPFSPKMWKALARPLKLKARAIEMICPP